MIKGKNALSLYLLCNSVCACVYIFLLHLLLLIFVVLYNIHPFFGSRICELAELLMASRDRLLGSAWNLSRWVPFDGDDGCGGGNVSIAY